jgi:hypothetical protein
VAKHGGYTLTTLTDMGEFARSVRAHLIRLEPTEKYRKQKFSLNRKRLYASTNPISCSLFCSIYNAVALRQAGQQRLLAE